MKQLFTKQTIKNVELKNRIMMSPMCMYSSTNEDGMLTPFHFTHLTSRALGQVGLIMTEATAVRPEGRISNKDLGIWSEEHVAGFTELNKQLHGYGAKSAIQLAHAGRKAVVDEDIFAPSALAFDESYDTPVKMTTDKIKEAIVAFTDAARRAKAAGFDIIELHGAHGYLISQFLSPLTNKRVDEYGGTREKRYRFLSEIITSVKTVWDGPIFVRISTDEYHVAGNTLDDILYFAGEMKKQGIDLIDCSSGGVVPAEIHSYPGYQVPRCERIKHEVGIKTCAVGLITSGIQAEEILQNDRADLVAIGRGLLRDPHWAKTAAEDLHTEIEAPRQYSRGWR